MQNAELSVTRFIKAPRTIVFDAWTTPEQLKQWWGPGKVFCPEAHIDLKVGGHYRIANQLEKGDLLWISGTFEDVSPPEKLIYDWNVGTKDDAPSLVTVLFNAHPDGTELIIKHTRIKDEPLRDNHKMGWIGCLDKLQGLYVG